MRIAVCLDLVSGSKQIKVNRYVKTSIYISHYLHNLMKFSLHNLLDFELNDVISKLGPTDSYDFSLIWCELSNFHQNENISCLESRVFGYFDSIVSSKCMQLTDNICKAVVDETTSL